MNRRLALVALAAMAAACGGSSGGPGAPSSPSPGPAQLSVGGDYAMAVALTENGCGAVTVEPLPTRVAHAAGSTQIQLTHGPATYAGTVDAAGRFTTQPRVFTDAAGSQTLAIAGQFTTTGFQATVTVDVQPAGAAACRYVVRWTGTKTGAPNVIP